jgi:hypothetical protein
MAGSPWSNQVVSLIVIQAGGGFTGVFVYSPTPGTGNLVISIAAQTGTDPYGNSYPEGFAAFMTPVSDKIQAAFGNVPSFSRAGLTLTDLTSAPHLPAAFMGGAASGGSAAILTSGFSTSSSEGGQLTLSDSTQTGESDGQAQIQGYVAMLTTVGTPSTPSGQVLLYYHGGSLIALGPSGNKITVATT